MTRWPWWTHTLIAFTGFGSYIAATYQCLAETGASAAWAWLLVAVGGFALAATSAAALIYHTLDVADDQDN